ncbi:hypothetical protein CN03_01085 [Thalassolituus oleivorans]|uniref:hypothetical protein n=1 Tax=Thalassolituus oleivorans TaxID=187493 RepID=UPI00094937D8|nr:hypothetical protein [Thalassolituus oleivorans]APR65635.1 hypothetical protein CN03_01085 [Thalassolituus oleivorans]
MKFAPLLSLLLLTSLGITGCASYGAGIQGALTKAEQGDYAGSEAIITSSLTPDGNDRLLYHLELGVLKHLQGDYAASNDLLERAAQISESLDTISVSNSFYTLMTNPRQGPYGGADYEKVLINYYKALNYFGLAQLALTRNERLDAIEGARIEARRLIIRLNDLKTRLGTYQQASDAKEQTFNQLMRIFELLLGNWVNNDDFLYRDDALAHYLSGLSFEMNGEYDDARISYQTAATSYGTGYAKQFRLADGMEEQAWFDTVRMMRTAGGYDNEWRQLAKKHLSKVRQDELNTLDGKAQLIVIEHKGLVSQRKEMSLELSVNPNLKSLNIRPYFIGYEADQLAWFWLLYADKSVYQLVTAYLNAVRNNELRLFTKTVALGPLYREAENIGLTQAVGNSMRITVPYYSPPQILGSTRLSSDGASWTMLEAASPEQMAVQEQIVRSGKDIQLALARSALKAITAASIGNGDSSGFLAFAGKLAAQLTDAAETRSWLLLPANIRVSRVFLEPGEHQVSLDSDIKNGQHYRDSKRFTLKPGDIELWQVRSMAASTGSTVVPTPETNTAKPPQRTVSDGAAEPAPTNDDKAIVSEKKPTRSLPSKE